MSQRNDFLKKDFKEKMLLKENQFKALELENQVLAVKLDQERGIKESEKEFYQRKQDGILVDLREKEKEIHVFKENFVALEYHNMQNCQKLDELNTYVKKIEREKMDFERKLNSGRLICWLNIRDGQVGQEDQSITRNDFYS